MDNHRLSRLLSRLRISWWKPRTTADIRKSRGKQAERLACAFLRANGFEVLERNVRFPVGEIDLIAQEGRTLCFIEVRSTGSEKWGGPLASITNRKRRRIQKAARWYWHRRPIKLPEARFDVVAVDWGNSHPPHRPKIQLIRGAFSADEWIE